MSFSQRVWNDRVSEYPNRRLLTDEDENTSLVTFTRSEGQVSSEGDAWNAENMNDLESRIAAVLGTCEFYIGADGKPYVTYNYGGEDIVKQLGMSEGCNFYVGEDGKPYVSYTYNGEEVIKKLGSSDGTATTDQVLVGATFNSANTSDDEDYSTGTMANYSGATQSATVSQSGTDVLLTIPNIGYYDTDSKLKCALSNISKSGTVSITLTCDRRVVDNVEMYAAVIKLSCNGQSYSLDTGAAQGDHSKSGSWAITL